MNPAWITQGLEMTSSAAEEGQQQGGQEAGAEGGWGAEGQALVGGGGGRSSQRRLRILLSASGRVSGGWGDLPRLYRLGRPSKALQEEEKIYIDSGPYPSQSHSHGHAHADAHFGPQ